MNREEALQLLRGGENGVEEWNKRRPTPAFDLEGNLIEEVDLSCADLTGAELSFVDLQQVKLVEANLDKAALYGANLSGADLSKASLCEAELVGARLKFTNLRGADLRGIDLMDASCLSVTLADAKLNGACLAGAYLHHANLAAAELVGANIKQASLIRANLCGANLIGADLSEANLSSADLSEANLQGANLRGASLVKANLMRANLTGCMVYGISAWGLRLEGARQSDLVITDEGEPVITLDNVEVAQFVYLLLNNATIRNVIDTVTAKVVLILGRFLPERKKVLEIIRQELRSLGYVPILFDFEKPRSRDFVETVSTLAHLSRFVIADFTDAKIVLEEVPHIVRNIAVPVKPLLMEGSGDEPVTILDLRRNHRSLLSTQRYEDVDALRRSFRDKVVLPAEQMAEEVFHRAKPTSRNVSSDKSSESSSFLEEWTVIDPGAVQAQQLPTSHDLGQIPRWGIVAFASRCASRVQALFEIANLPDIRWEAFVEAVELAARSARSADVTAAQIRAAAKVASYAYEEADKELSHVSPDMQNALICTIHAAASCVNAVISADAAASSDKSRAAEAALRAAYASCRAADWWDYKESCLLSNRHRIITINAIASDFSKLNSAAVTEMWGEDSYITSSFFLE